MKGGSCSAGQFFADGNDINIGAGSTLNLQSDFTVTAWVKLDNTSGKHTAIGNPGWAFRSTGTSPQITTFGVKDYTGTAGTLASGVWTHVAVVLDSNYDAQFYVNGQPAGFVTHTAQGNSNTNPFAIGATSPGNVSESMAGRIDDVRVFSGALTQAEVQATITDFTARPVELITPVSVSLDAGSQYFSVDHLIDDSGLSGAADMGNYRTITHAGSNGDNSWVTNAYFPDYYTGGGTTPVMTFDLGDRYDLSDIVAWNYSSSGNATRTVTVEFSVDGVGGPFDNALTIEVPQAAGPAHTISLGGTFLANAVRLTFDDNWRGFGGGGDRVGLNELKFIGSVPEPSTFLLGALGLFGLGLVGRRRRGRPA